MQFSEIIGQSAVKQRLINTFRDGRLSHAQLFLGPEGCGTLTLAIAYSQYINCQNRTETDSCGTCSSCMKYKGLVHPDLHFVFPIITSPKFKEPVSDHFITEWRKINVETKSNFNLNEWLEYIDAENKQGSIQKNESSEINRKLNLKTYEADYKTMIIWMADKMNETCANKILKILEEPPPNTLFILISENTDAILATILSRTQIVKIPKIDKESMFNYIQAEYGLAEIEAKYVAENANGNIIATKSIVKMSEELGLFFESFTTLMRKSYQRDFEGLIDWSKQVATWGREKQKTYLEYCLGMVRNNFVMNQKANDILHMSKMETDFSSKFSVFITDTNIEEFSILLSEAHYHIERNGSAKIIFLDMALKIAILFAKKR
jgi:DNA polymerase III subunit delta'